MFRSQIPESLWQNEKLLLPPALVGALREELQGRALYAEACVEDKPDSELFGGKDAEVKKIRDQYRANAERLLNAYLDNVARIASRPVRP